MSILIIAEYASDRWQENIRSTLSVVRAAMQLQAPIHILLAGHACDAGLAQLMTVKGVEKVWLADHIAYRDSLAESWVPLIKQVLKQDVYRYVMTAANRFGKNIMPRLSGALGVAMISDVIEVLDSNTYRRFMYAGNVLATVRLTPLGTQPQLLTVRTTMFKPVSGDRAMPVLVETVPFVVDNHQSYFISRQTDLSAESSLEAAHMVIAAGRGLETQERVDQLVRVAKRMGAAMAASRALVDAGMLSNALQVGQTGKVVAPTFYFAVGISGAIQHTAGMKGSQVIIAINKDPKAPIFELAHYGVVMDIAEALPQWDAALTGIKIN